MIFLKIKLTLLQSQFLSAHSVSTFYQSYLSCHLSAASQGSGFLVQETVCTSHNSAYPRGGETQPMCCAVDDIHGNEAASPRREWGGGLFCNFYQLLNMRAVPHQEQCLRNSLLNASSSHCPLPPATFHTEHTHWKYQRLEFSRFGGAARKLRFGH